jgi:hypothetical protein
VLGYAATIERLHESGLPPIIVLAADAVACDGRGRIWLLPATGTDRSI